MFDNAVARMLTLFGCVLVLGAVLSTSANAQTLLVYDELFLAHDPGETHPERAARLPAIMLELKSQGLLDRVVRLNETRAASSDALEFVHTKDYLQTLEEAARNAPSKLDPDTVVSKRSYEVAKHATGGVLQAVDAVANGEAQNAFVVSRPPGHHAFADRGRGFCLLNHVAIAARYAQREHRLKRILIVDWDVHHGDGTQAIFYDDPTVLFFSTHQYPYYPGTGSEAETGTDAGTGLTINVPIPAGGGDEEVIGAFENQLVSAADAFAPDLVLVSAGFDAHVDDPLAQLELTAAGYAKLTEIVAKIAARHAKGRIVSVLEGGYDLKALGRSVAAHVSKLNEYAGAAN